MLPPNVYSRSRGIANPQIVFVIFAIGVVAVLALLFVRSELRYQKLSQQIAQQGGTKTQSDDNSKPTVGTIQLDEQVDIGLSLAFDTDTVTIDWRNGASVKEIHLYDEKTVQEIFVMRAGANGIVHPYVLGTVPSGTELIAGKAGEHFGFDRQLKVELFGEEEGVAFGSFSSFFTGTKIE